jgi:hypothetical protein
MTTSASPTRQSPAPAAAAPPPLAPASLVRRFAGLTALRWFPIGLYVPVAVLLMQARGLDLATIGTLYALYGVVTLGLELPTGGLADAMGRRTVLVTASIATAAGLAVGAFAQDAPAFALAMTVGAIGRALGSGPLEAWFVDAAGQTGGGDKADDIVRTGLSRAASAEALALGLGSVVGGLLPGLVALVAVLPATGHDALLTLSVPSLLAAGGMLVHGLAAFALVCETPSAARSGLGLAGLARGVPATVERGVRLGFGDRVLRRLVLRAVLLGVVLSGVELLAPGTFAAMLGGEQQASAAFGILAAFAFSASALGAWLAPLAARRLGGGARAAATMSALAAPAAIAVALPVLAIAGGGYVGIYLLLGVVGPLTSELLHGRIASGERATMVSVESLALQAGGVVANLTLGALATTVSPMAAFGAVAAALVASAILLGSIPPRRATDAELAPEPPALAA